MRAWECSKACPDLPKHHNGRAIKSKCVAGSASHCCPSRNPPCPRPSKMFIPAIAAWMKKTRDRPSFGIDRVSSRPFLQGTCRTGKRQIGRGCGSAINTWMNVIDMKRRFLRPLRQSTVFAQIASALADLRRKSCGNGRAHVSRLPADAAARAFKSDSMSTSSASAFASRRSRTGSLPRSS